MKMMGLKSWMLWLGWFLHAICVNFFSILAIVFLMKVKLWGASYPPIEYCDASVYALLLLLYCGAAITFCLFISSLFNKRKFFCQNEMLGSLLFFLIRKLLQIFVISCRCDKTVHYHQKIFQTALIQNIAKRNTKEITKTIINKTALKCYKHIL